MSNSAELQERFAGVLIGTAVGDAIGLPAEGLSRSRIDRRWHGVWRHRFIFGCGMWSDDTEHTIFVAQALLSEPTMRHGFNVASPGNCAFGCSAFQQESVWRHSGRSSSCGREFLPSEAAFFPRATDPR